MSCRSEKLSSEAQPPSYQAIRKLSCRRCQFRKLKCSRTVPCSNCTAVEQHCEYRVRDEKRRPITQEYSKTLESQITQLQSLIMEIKEASPVEREAMLEPLFFPRRPHQNQYKAPEPSNNTLDMTLLEPKLDVDRTGSMIYHGPTSIYRIWPIEQIPYNLTSHAVRPKSESDLEHIAGQFGIDLETGLITDALMLFFKWQYPHSMFIYREAFLRDHFGDRSSCKYWSPSLLLAICALGTLMQSNANFREESERFFAAAESVVLIYDLSQPSITTVQTLLCLSFYEIGRGNSSKGWGLSGMAYRMAQDLGFQRDPKHWLLRDITLTSPEDLEIRRRIYWGCYASDKLISLILGRSVFFHENDAEVDWVETLPEIPGMLPWLPAGQNEHDTRPTTVLVQCFREQVSLLHLVESILSKLFSQNPRLDLASRQALLDSLNLDLCRWHDSLPSFIRWTRWEPTDRTLHPSIAGLHVLYHSIRIVLESSACPGENDRSQAENVRATCLSSAQDTISIVRRYRSIYGLKYAPFIFVYGIVQALRAAQTLGIAEEIQYLEQVLEECSFTWELAQHIKR